MYKCTEICISCYKYKINDNFLKRLVIILGPVLMGSKSSELLSFPKHDKYLLDKIEIIKKYIRNCKRIKYKLFKVKNENIKILFYNPKVLDKNLKEYKNLRFLKNMGYPEEYDLEIYLQFLIDKMADGIIPHEIGVFLGYPLKDVIGFIGHPSLKLTKINGWRVYGDPRLSDKRFNEFLEDKNEIKKLLKFNEPEEILLSM